MPDDPRDETATRLADVCTPLGDVTVKAMFGGRGVFVDGQMFALVDREGAPFLKGDDATSSDFESRGGEKHSDRMPYWRVPEAVWTDDATLLSWGERAATIARG